MFSGLRLSFDVISRRVTFICLVTSCDVTPRMSWIFIFSLILSLRIMYSRYWFNMQFSKYMDDTVFSVSSGLKWPYLSSENYSHQTLVGLSGLEPPTSRLSGVRSNQLSYKPAQSWHPPALPCRLQHSTIGRTSLNRRVRDGNGCFPCAHRHQEFSCYLE